MIGSVIVTLGPKKRDMMDGVHSAMPLLDSAGAEEEPGGVGCAAYAECEDKTLDR